MLTPCARLQLCNGAVMYLFRTEELEQLVCGSHHLNTLELQAGAHYDDGYTAGSQVRLTDCCKGLAARGRSQDRCQLSARLLAIGRRPLQ